MYACDLFGMPSHSGHSPFYPPFYPPGSKNLPRVRSGRNPHRRPYGGEEFDYRRGCLTDFNWEALIPSTLWRPLE